MSINLSRELVLLLLEYLEGEEYKETVHTLEKESGFFFNMKYVEECVTNGDWDGVESYLSGFTKLDENEYSMKIFFEIRKQRYLEALDRHDHTKAVEILQKDLKLFSGHNEGIYKELALLLTFENFRENDQLSKQGNANFVRANMLDVVKELIELNPVFHDKLQYPSSKKSRLKGLINQSLNWQHYLCTNSKQDPDIKTLFHDHSCGPMAFNTSPVTKPLKRSLPKAGLFPPKAGRFPPKGGHGPSQPAAAQHTASLAGWIANPSSVPHQMVTAGPIGLTAPNYAPSFLKRIPLTNNPAIDCQIAGAEHVFKRSRASGVLDEVNKMPLDVLPVTFPGHSTHTLYASGELPKIVIANFSQGSAVMSMDFHPQQQSLLLVGTNIGDITVWEVGSKLRLLSRSFNIWDVAACSATLQVSLVHASTASVNRVIWSPDGFFIGVAYSMHLVHIYSYHGRDDLRDHLEIAAHVGNVTDLAFSHLNKQLCITSCGEDKIIKVWDGATGEKLYTFEGHEAPVYSVYTHRKENIPFIFSASFDGKIKAWVYYERGPVVEYDAPGHACIKMAYSADGKRLFSCGTSKQRESYLLEWNAEEGEVKRVYNGLGKRTVGIVQFDTTKNRFLVAGDDFHIKFWEMDNVDLLDSIDAGGGLPASPCVRFNKDGILLAVSTNDNGIKVLANANGIEGLRSIGNCAIDAYRITSGTPVKGPVVHTFGASSSPGTNNGIADRNALMSLVVYPNRDGQSCVEGKRRVSAELEKSKFRKMTEVNEPSHLRSLRLPDSLLPSRIVRLIYAKSGAILALTHSGVHKLWIWKNEQNVLGKETTIVPPEFLKSQIGISMTNDILETHCEDSVACFAVSKNESFLVSASGGEISIFNMITFKRMISFKPSPSAATCLAFKPQDNNFIAIGMADSTIHIYNVNTGEVNPTIKGHRERVTGLAFSTILNILVSSGADSELMVWSLDGWEKQAGKLLKSPAGRLSKPPAQIGIKFQKDEIHLLVIQDTQLAIFEASKLECLEQWVPGASIGLITDATYSCNCQSVYATFEDGNVSILTIPSFQLRCRIYPTAYLPSSPRMVYPAAVAAHPSEPNQFAIGLSDGGVVVLEPPESTEQWGSMPPVEGAGHSTRPRS